MKAAKETDPENASSHLDYRKRLRSAQHGMTKRSHDGVNESTTRNRKIRETKCSSGPVIGEETEEHEEVKSKRKNCEPEESSELFKIGSVVWAKLAGSPWWPGIVINPSWCGMERCEASERMIYWFGNYKVSEVKCNYLLDFKENFRTKFNAKKIGMYRTSVVEACKETARKAGDDIGTWEISDCQSWAENNFPKLNLPFEDVPEKIPEISNAIMKHLKEIEYKNAKAGRNNLHYMVRGSAIQIDRNSENIKKFVKKELTLYEVCLSCFLLKEQFSASQNEDIQFHDHPIFEGSICSTCIENLKVTLFSYEDTGKHMYCCICSVISDGEFVCDNIDCGRTFCTLCIEIFAQEMKENLSEDWICFICDSSQNTSSLKSKSTWKSNILKLYEEPDQEKSDILSETFTGGKIRVLSLFDGIATGFHVLHELGLDVEAYFASEIDEDAMNVGKVKFGGKIQYIGDVRDIDEMELNNILPIHLLLGGSPCNDLSFVNPLRKGLYNVNGSGFLFFEFYRIMILLNKIQKPNRIFFLFENVTAMDQKFKNEISRCLNCSPVMIDAQYFSAAHRARLFWGNIPGIKKMMFPANVPDLQDKLIPGLGRTATRKKLLTITTNQNSLRRETYATTPVTMDDEHVLPWVTELEAVFGFPHHYTDTGNISLLRRQQLLGKAWCVDVILHILRPLRSYFTLKSNEK